MVLLGACGGAAAPVAIASPSPTAVTNFTPVPTPTPVPTTAAPTAAPTPTPAPTPTIVTVSGSLTDAATGGPVAGQAVVFYDGPKYCATGGVGIAPESVSQTKSDGSYSVKMLAGSYFVAVNGTRANNDYQGVFYSTCPSATKIDHDLTINMTIRHK